MWVVILTGWQSGPKGGLFLVERRSTSAVHAVQAFHDVFPHLITATDVPNLCKIDDVNFDSVDAVFCCLPHATTQVKGVTSGGLGQASSSSLQRATAPSVPWMGRTPRPYESNLT